MKNTIMWIRSLLFFPLFYAWGLGITTVCCFTLLMPRRITLIVPTIWAYGNRFLLRVVCGIKIEITGLENLPKKNGYIVASKHQSALETVIFHMLIPHSIYVMKKSLFYLPVAGLYFWKTGCILIDRSKGTSAMRLMLDKAQERISKGYNIIIFPEGTRTAPGSEPKYNPGVALLYERCQVPVIPAALNTGYFWPKNSFKRFPGVVRFSFLPPIEQGLERRAFLAELEKQVETECQKLIPKK